MNTNFKAIGLTRLGIKPKSTAPEADVLTIRPSELLNVKQEKRGENLLFWRSHSYVDLVLQKKVFTLFFNQRAARSFNSFSKSGPLCEKFAHPWF